MEQWQALFSWAPNTAYGAWSHEIKRHLFLGRKTMTNLDSMLKSRDITLPTKVHLVKAMVFRVVIHVRMWELDHKEDWVPKNWCFLNCSVGEDSWESLDCKEMKSVNPKGNQPWIFIVQTDAKAEIPIFWPPDAKGWLIRKNADAGNDWRQEEKGTI